MDKKVKRYTKEELDFIRKVTPGRHYHEIVEMFNKKFDFQINTKKLKETLKNHRISTGLTGRFEKGHVPYNKGKKFPGTGNRTTFRKGATPHNKMKVGEDAITTDGYVKTKIAEPDVWEYKHKLIWVEANGPIPEKHSIIFADGNKLNLSIDNLLLVSKAELLMLNRKKLISENSELTKTGLNVVKVMNKVYKIKKGE
uniref:HNH endonuclease n=1 Tax=Siphoviridae sp. ctTic26 TaxID=2823583 RepID=A0A8S5LEC6_9CAUD|nr:MAG TPA: HNH endonuclease [Siphoviridae sp. ctTic26]